LVRWIVPALIALAIAVGLTVSYLQDPHRLAEQRWDAAFEAPAGSDAAAALARLDEELQRDATLVDTARAERGGAEVIRLAVSRVAAPFTADAIDPAMRVVGRYAAL